MDRDSPDRDPLDRDPPSPQMETLPWTETPLMEISLHGDPLDRDPTPRTDIYWWPSKKMVHTQLECILVYMLTLI